ncbi:MAG: 4Fe-4S ferredoxin [Bacteroidetes bacterium]|nr:MAG: 4Fe-4S ferredoxin [Bacteroidota bacterium]PTM13596.1 MAG: 4Fe-4S ferredoxin [Bacteroidota bacterium]
MKNHKNNVWIGTEQLNKSAELAQASTSEFVELPVTGDASEAELHLESNRRDFLKYLGFGIGVATIAACDVPVRKAIPYVVKPDSIVPGVATYYASSFVVGGDYCPLLVKTREGRPIKVEGNSLSPITRGGTSAKAQACVLGLYDTSRFDAPRQVAEGKFGESLSWADLDTAVGGKLKAGSRVRIVANTILSPTTRQAIADFKVAYPNAEVVMYDSVSSSALLQANEASFGQRVVPAYQFDKAKVIVAIDCDFLGSWVSPIEFARQYAAGRRVSGKNPQMSRHIQVESYMSLSGSNADNRVPVKPSEIGAVIVGLYNEIAKAKGQSAVSGPKLPADKQAKVVTIAKELLGASGTSLVVSASNNQGEQVLVNAINELLGNYGQTIGFDRPLLTRQGDDTAAARLIKEMQGGGVDAVIVMDGANPAYNMPNAAAFRTALAKVGLKISLSGTPNETALLCDYVAPTHHFLESWGDAEPKRGSYSLIQPTIAPIFASVGRAGTRQGEESLLTWAQSPALDTTAEQPYEAYLAANWERTVFVAQNKYLTFQKFWDATLHDGILELPVPATTVAFAADVNAAAAKVRKPANSELEITFYETVNMGGGEYANNPWLQEMPDPITRCVWGNYLAIPVTWDGGNSWSAMNDLNQWEFKGKADQVKLSIAGTDQQVTCVRQFGQPTGTTALALGYGRTVTGMVGRALGNEVGTNVYDWLKTDSDGNVQYFATEAMISEAVSEEVEFACVQYHHTMGVTARKDGETVLDEATGKPLNVDEKTVMTLGAGFQGGLTNRSIIYQGKLSELPELQAHITEKRAEAESLNQETLYPYEEYSENLYSQGHHWGMHVDLNACIGCGACQVACVAENNVPVVGKHEVFRHHEMTWLRIDRYYYGDYENPKVVYQPMMCQHCDNAPCENVCPVAATNHSSEGLNQMTYNRCIGTRYCANNCPYKVRRFNWLDYTTADLFGMNEPTVNGETIPYGADNLTRMVLNPDVTVRSRGVIEKCSFCVQRIQQGKLTAKRELRRLEDADVRTACQTACPTGAIVFGDQNNTKGDIAERLENPLNYLVLEEINTRPSVYYAARVNNSKEELEA